MKQYDFYLAMSPESDSGQWAGELTMMLLESGLTYTRHVGQRNNIAARRDINRLMDCCGAMLYVADEAHNSSELAIDEVDKAERDGVDIVVLRIDMSDYPKQIATPLMDAVTFDATHPEQRRAVFGDVIERLGGKVSRSAN